MEKYVVPAVEVEAHQWWGRDGLEDILHWLGGVFYVGQGEDSPLRRHDEVNSKGQANANAEEFLIIKTQSGDDRVNLKDWIVRYDARHISVYDPLTFAYTFEEGVKHEQPC